MLLVASLYVSMKDRSDVRCKEKGRVGEDFPCPGVKGLNNVKYANHLCFLILAHSTSIFCV